MSTFASVGTSDRCREPRSSRSSVTWERALQARYFNRLRFRRKSMRKFAMVALVLFGGMAYSQTAQPSNACLIVKQKGTLGRRLIYFALMGFPIAPGGNYVYVDSAKS